MKKKVYFASLNENYINGMAELLNAEGDFESLGRFNVYNDYNYDNIDLILLDDDMEMITFLRDKGYNNALIGLFSSDENKLFQAFDLGISDALLKPVCYESLITRIRVSIYMNENTVDGALTLNRFIFMPKARILRYVDREIKLTEKEAGIINLLFKSYPASVKRLDLLKNVWGYNAGISTHTLETHVYRLRQKIENVTDDKFITTLEDGYSLV